MAPRENPQTPVNSVKDSGVLLALELLGFQCLRVAFAVIDGLAKAADGITHVASQAAQALGAEQRDHDQQNDQKLPDTDAHHLDLLLYLQCRPWRPAWLSGVQLLMHFVIRHVVHITVLHRFMQVAMLRRRCQLQELLVDLVKPQDRPVVLGRQGFSGLLVGEGGQ